MKRTIGGWEVYFFEELSSTQDEARRIYRARAAEGRPGGGFAVVAARQTAGRGRLGRRWASPPGGLYATVVYSPPRDLAPLRGAVAARAALARFGVPAEIRWPNDLVVPVEPAARKIGGVLAEVVAEAGRSVLLLGVGLDLGPTPEAEVVQGVPRAIGAAELLGRAIPVEEALAALLSALDMPLRPEAVVAEANRHLHGVGRRARLADGTEAIVEGIAADGALVLHPLGASDPVEEIHLHEWDRVLTF